MQRWSKEERPTLVEDNRKKSDRKWRGSGGEERRGREGGGREGEGGKMEKEREKRGRFYISDFGPMLQSGYSDSAQHEAVVNALQSAISVLAVIMNLIYAFYSLSLIASVQKREI